jgi:sugar/nucleoside kinase (ribokinase family)
LSILFVSSFLRGESEQVLMDRVKVVGLGMACLDIVVRMHDMPTWEQGTRLEAVTIDGGGPVATAVVAVQRLGVPAGFIGTCGSDRLGDIKMQTLVEQGLDVSQVVRRDGPEDQTVLVSVHAETGERVFSGYKHWARTPLSANEINRDYIVAADYLHLDGTHPEAALQAAHWMHEAGKTVVLDGSSTREPVRPAMRALVEEADILISGSGFGPSLTGLANVWEIGEAIVRTGPKIVVQTEGKAGAFTVTADEHFHTPSFDVEVLDTTGAGDVFHGAYIVGLLNGWDLRQTAWFATAVSALKLRKLGGRAGIPAFEETLDFLAARGIVLGTKATDTERIRG